MMEMNRDNTDAFWEAAPGCSNLPAIKCYNHDPKWNYVQIV